MSILLHVALIGAIAFQFNIGKRDFLSHGDDDGEPASRSSATDLLITRVYFAQDEVRSSEVMKAAAPQDLDLGDVARDGVTVATDAMTSFDTPVLSTALPQAGDSNEGSGNAGNPAAEVDSYLGQIKSRVERTWDRPVVLLNERFECQVTITQDRQGGVREIVMGRCNGDAAWQQSLVRAIRLAAPLPAAPSAETFAKNLSLRFAAEPMSLETLVSILPLADDASQRIATSAAGEGTTTRPAILPMRVDPEREIRRASAQSTQRIVRSAGNAPERVTGRR
jgi:hypothetical protein